MVEHPRPVISNPENPTRRAKTRCCYAAICLLATSLLLTLLAIVLILTVFKVREPIITLNKITLKGSNGGPPIQPGSNISLTGDMSFKNPNLVMFRFRNSTSSIYYGGIMVGQAHGPGGRVGAQQTQRVNISGVIITDRVIEAPNLSKDIGSGLFTMDSYTRVPGSVKILKVVKKRVVVEINCTVSFNISSQEVQDQSCKRHVYFKL